jgi:hypothetical protein
MSEYYETEVIIFDHEGNEVASHPLTVEIELVTPSTAPSGMYGPPEFYDPGDGPEFDILSFEIFVGNDRRGSPININLTPEEYEGLFPQHQQAAQNAIEWAQDHERDFL